MREIMNNFNKSNVTSNTFNLFLFVRIHLREENLGKESKISIAPKRRRSRQSDRFEDIVRSFEGAKNKKGSLGKWLLSIEHLRELHTRLFVSTHNISYARRRR